MDEPDLSGALNFPNAEFNVLGDKLIPTDKTVSNAAAALASDDTTPEVKASASDVLNLKQQNDDDKPENHWF